MCIKMKKLAESLSVLGRMISNSISNDGNMYSRNLMVGQSGEHFGPKGIKTMVIYIQYKFKL